jgi:hypothetical protein
MVEDFDVVEVCRDTVVACVELEVCDCMVSGFVFVIFPYGFDVLHCVVLDEAMASWENFCCVFCFISLFIVSKLGGGGGVCLF